MANALQDAKKSGYGEMSLEQVEDIRISLRERKRGLVVNQQILFKYTAHLPPSKRIGVMIAGWGPIVLFPLAPVLYFVDWKFALLTIFLCIFWVGMGRKFAEAVLRKQCYEDSSFLKFALGVALVKLT